MPKLPYVLLFLFAASLLACSDDKVPTDAPQVQATKPIDHAPWVVDSNQIQTTPEGLQYYVVEEGTGAVVQARQSVTVHYYGYFPETRVSFDGSYKRGEPYTTPIGVGQVIDGWDLGIVGQAVGTKLVLIVPPELGYGATDQGPIPGNSTLVFDVEIIDVQ